MNRKSLELKEVKRVVTAFIKRNSIILVNTSRAVEASHVNLHWWDDMCAGRGHNLGDYLSEIILEYMLKYYNIIETNGRKNKTFHLYGIGSIISAGYQDAVVWGSGIIADRMYWWRNFRKLDIRCVRGPLTREILLNNGYECPEIYGDPAVLMPYIYSPVQTDKVYEYVLIHHHSVAESSENLSPKIKLLSIVTHDYKHFIDTIVAAKCVISSSLHGIILAETYGVPAIFLHENNLDKTKFEDYYRCTGRTRYPEVSSIAEAMNTAPIDLPNFTKMRHDLIEAFPVDIYDRS